MSEAEPLPAAIEPTEQPEPSAAASPPPKARRPRWTYVIPYVGTAPDLPPHQWRTLGLLAAAELFEQYDLGIFGLALLQIQQGLGIPEAQLGGFSALIRLGVIPALALTVFADRWGRRRLLLLTILGFTACTFATAFVTDPRQFVAVQFLARIFIAGEAMLAVVVIAEELRAEDRGWGIGMLGALGALGHGVAALMFGFVELLPFGWRALYAVGVLPMLLLAWFRRGLPETRRFEEHRAARVDLGGWRDAVQPLVDLARMYPRRLALLALAILPLEFFTMSAAFFMVKVLQEAHGYSPGQVTALYIAGGMLAIIGNVVAGQASDRFGRRRVIAFLIGVLAVAYWLFYGGDGWWIALVWILQVFALQGVAVLFKALGSELFPTSYRSTASGVRAIMGTLGGAGGLAFESFLYPYAGSHAMAIIWMLPALAIPPLAVLFGMPETATRELEEIAPER